MINKITITGADNFVDPQHLAALSEEFPFVEWGILFSPTVSKAPRPRYPSWDWVQELLRYDNMQLCAHLCKEYAYDPTFVYENTDVFSKFQRCQLNVNAQTVDNIQVIFGTHLPTYKSIFSDVIIQYNENNHVMVEFAKLSVPDIHILYDASGGKGVLANKWDEPFPGNYTGYAGGLSPDNIHAEINKIEYETELVDVWIDMESGVRTDNQLDLDKVRFILESL